MNQTQPRVDAPLPLRPTQDPARPAYATVPDWCRLSGMARTTTYAELGRGNLRAIKLGARTLIDVAHGLAWMASLTTAEFRTPAGDSASQHQAA